MDGGEAAAPAHELLLMRATGIYCWPKPTMGRTIFGAHTGALLLTNQRLVFMSSGGTDAWSKMAWVARPRARRGGQCDHGGRPRPDAGGLDRKSLR